MKRKSRCFLMGKNGGMRCKDGLYRSLVFFGTYPECLKFWSSEGWARRAAEKDMLSDYTIYHVYPNDKVECNGNIIRGAF